MQASGFRLDPEICTGPAKIPGGGYCVALATKLFSCRQIPGYPRIDRSSDFLIARFDSLIIDALPWNRALLAHHASPSSQASERDSDSSQPDRQELESQLHSLEVCPTRQNNNLQWQESGVQLLPRPKPGMCSLGRQAYSKLTATDSCECHTRLSKSFTS